MNSFKFSLNSEDYTWKNALLWGYFSAHLKKSQEGRWQERLVHSLIATAELLPIIGQITSLFEKFAVSLKKSALIPSTEKDISFTPIKGVDKVNFCQLQSNSESKPKETAQSPTLLADTSLSQSVATIQEEIARELAKEDGPKPIRTLTALAKESQNPPIPLKALKPKSIEHFAKEATFYAYNAEGIYDSGWGCAWRALQTTLSCYDLPANQTAVQTLFHTFGRADCLKLLYHSKHHREIASRKAFAPYNLSNGWAEPFIGEMALHFHRIPSSLHAVNGIPEGAYAPKEVFHGQEALNFTSFKRKLEKHFKREEAAPLMIDDATYSCNILGVKLEGEKTILWIGDPHIKPGASQKDNTSGLYTVTLNEVGEQIGCSLTREQKEQMLFSGSYQGLHFHQKKWMVLFPSSPLPS